MLFGKGKNNKSVGQRGGTGNIGNKKNSYWRPAPGKVYVKEMRRDLGKGNLIYVPMHSQDKLVSLVSGSWAKINRHKIVARFLRAKYPKVFKSFKPLSKNTNSVIIQTHCFDSNGIAQPKMIEIFGDILKTHCNSLNYLMNVIRFNHRYNLDGTPAERISMAEKKYAMEKLALKIKTAESRNANKSNTKMSRAYQEAKAFLANVGLKNNEKSS